MKTLIVIGLLFTVNLHAQQWFKVSKTSKRFCSNRVVLIDTNSFMHIEGQDTTVNEIVITYKDSVNADSIDLTKINISDVSSMETSYRVNIAKFRNDTFQLPALPQIATLYNTGDGYLINKKDIELYNRHKKNGTLSEYFGRNAKK